MANVYFRQMEFYKLAGEELKEFKRHQRKLAYKVFLKRLFLSLLIIGIAVALQRLARITIPHRFKERDTIQLLYIKGLLVFLGFNLLSIIQLVLRNKFWYSPKKLEFVKVSVKKKYVVVQMTRVVTSKYRFLSCETEGEFILDRVNVYGPFVYGGIREYTDVYVARVPNDAVYEYVYVA